MLKSRFAKKKTKSYDLDLLCGDVIFEQQPRRGVTAESTCGFSQLLVFAVLSTIRLLACKDYKCDAKNLVCCR